MKNETISVSENNLAGILNDCSIDAIIAFDTDYIVIAWNKTAEIMYGRSKQQAMGKSIFRLLPHLKEDAETVNAINVALKGHKSFVPAGRLYSHRQQTENHYTPLTDKEGNIMGVMNIVHDVAHRIKAEQQLQHLNDELKKRYRQLQITSGELASFTYITSNKIKEPIRQIYTGVEHLIKVEATRLTDSGKASFRRMQSSLNRMDLLLDDVLSIAQISILQKADTPVNLNEVLKEVIANMKGKLAEKNAEVVVEESCTIIGHKSLLHLLFYNLIDNAIKFNDSSIPLVKINCKKVVLDKINEPLAETECYCVTVTDNGIGFEASDTDKIFGMFEKLHSGKYKGSGIGLTIARKVMDAHDGFIHAESVAGGGSSFHCFFPIIPV